MSHIISQGDASSSNDLGELKQFGNLLRDARQPLSSGCRKSSKLNFLVKLLHLKTIDRWSNKHSL